MPLTDIACKNAKPKEKPYKLADEKALYLWVTPAGGKIWRMEYRFGGSKNKKPLVIGKYPEFSLKEVRERRDEARKLLARGIDPGEAKKDAKKAREEAVKNTFKAVAEEWLDIWSGDKASVTVAHVRARLKHFILPFLADKPVADIEAPEILAAVRSAEAKGLRDTPGRVKTDISQVLCYAIETGRRKLADPVPYLKNAVKKNTVKHQPAFTKPKDVARLLKAIDSHAANPQTSLFVSAAMRLLPLVFSRPGELIGMKWADVNLDKGEWFYFVTKVKTWHLVPLSRQTVAILREIEPYREGEYVFPSRSRTAKHMSNMAINRALQDMGFDTRREHTSHGCRATARTMLREQLKYDKDLIEFQLSHGVRDPLGYGREEMLPERREMMQEWADYLDELRYCCFRDAES